MSVSLQPSSSGRASSKVSRDEAIVRTIGRIHGANVVDQHLKMCIYARNKVGKTTFACSSNLKTLIIDCNEKGFASVRNRSNVDIYELLTWDDLDPVYWYLRAMKHDYKVVAIDTITMLATIGMKWVLKEDYDHDMTRDPQTPDRRSWGKLGEMLKDATIKFRNLPMHVLFLAQEKTSTSEDEDGGTIIEIHPELSPSPRSTLLSSVDIIGRLYAREVELAEGKKKMERRMLLRADPKFVSGNRFDELRPIERNPTLQSFIDRISGSKLNASTNA